jgi:hypothetical protein
MRTICYSAFAARSGVDSPTKPRLGRLLQLVGQSIGKICCGLTANWRAARTSEQSAAPPTSAEEVGPLMAGRRRAGTVRGESSAPVFCAARAWRVGCGLVRFLIAIGDLVTRWLIQQRGRPSHRALVPGPAYCRKLFPGRGIRAVHG